MHLLGFKLDPFRTLEVQFESVCQDLSLPLRAWGEHVCIFSAKTAQDARQILFGWFWLPFRFKMHLLWFKLDPFMTLTVQFDSVFQGLCLPLRVWGEHMCNFSAKIAQDARQFLGGWFWPPFIFKMYLLGFKLDPFRP